MSRKWGYCPNCNAEITEWDEVYQDCETIYQEFTCQKCGKQYCDIFTYTQTKESED